MAGSPQGRGLQPRRQAGVGRQAGGTAGTEWMPCMEHVGFVHLGTLRGTRWPAWIGCQAWNSPAGARSLSTGLAGIFINPWVCGCFVSGMRLLRARCLPSSVRAAGQCLARPHCWHRGHFPPKLSLSVGTGGDSPSGCRRDRVAVLSRCAFGGGLLALPPSRAARPPPSPLLGLALGCEAGSRGEARAALKQRNSPISTSERTGTKLN